ncbi:hypothetical protein [Ktedonobacter sp. SOSP1-52]|uniref:hypothetical protein n=1 Tax=Ktedonobacter sp. SOSP1-52 TaxID=2778366 RepID=UPI0019158F2D|nr:hypothetical protein [Ktedonobacter sp. SOSP1-52]
MQVQGVEQVTRCIGCQKLFDDAFVQPCQCCGWYACPGCCATVPTMIAIGAQMISVRVHICISCIGPQVFAWLRETGGETEC